MSLTASQQVYWWFWNRRDSTNGTTSKRKKGEKKNSILDLTKKIKKNVQPYQAYMSLKKKALTPTIKKEYEAHLRSVPEDQQTKWLAFMSKRSQEMYEAETEEVKAAVEAHRRKLVEGTSALDHFAEIGRAHV